MQPIINACLGVLIQPDSNFILLSSRPVGKVMAGYWEFPGGKIESGESCYEALQRELSEELGIEAQIESMQLIGKVEHNYPHGLAKLDLLLVNKWNGEIQPLEGQSFVWCNLSETSNFPVPLLPTTLKVFELLQDYMKG